MRVAVIGQEQPVATLDRASRNLFVIAPYHPKPDVWFPHREGPFGSVAMGGMFSVVNVRKNQKPVDYKYPGWYST